MDIKRRWFTNPTHTKKPADGDTRRVIRVKVSTITNKRGVNDDIVTTTKETHSLSSLAQIFFSDQTMS